MRDLVVFVNNGFEEWERRPNGEILYSNNCQKRDCELFQCSRCKHSYYCSRPCQRTAWVNGHREACQKREKELQTLTGRPFQVQCIGSGPGSKMCFLYTTGMTQLGLPELLAVDVEMGGFQNISALMNTCAENLFRLRDDHPALSNPEKIHRSAMSAGGDQNTNGYISYSALILVTKKSKKDARRLELLFEKFVKLTYRPLMDKLIVLMPICKGLPWGQLPPAPEGKNKLRNTVFQKLYHQQHFTSTGFIRYLDGNKNNHAISNVRPNVPLAEALAHHPEWAVNWDRNLDSEEISYVQEHREYFIPLVSEVPHAQADAYVDKISKSVGYYEKLEAGIKIGE